ncbi:Yanuthone D synthesis protein E [Talaromyces pinophilus]|nr:Yanuthone D synthesis protein E [Talaromyces pinophilus]
MAPVKPTSFTATANRVEKFDGAIVFEWGQPENPEECLHARVFMRPVKGIYKKHMEAGTKPPIHFHRHQYESFEVVGAGDLTCEIDGVQHRVRKGDPAVWIQPYANHVVYGTPGVEQPEIEMIVRSRDNRLMGRKNKEPSEFLLDKMFFENWYGYQEEVYQGKNKFDIIQILSTFDAGDTYMTLPRWVPFRHTVSVAAGIVLGRWIGGLLGYQPFLPEWTSDWQLACERMNRVWTQRRFADMEAQETARIRFSGLGSSN